MNPNRIEIVKALRGKRSGKYDLCHCPAHPDEHPSLTVSEAGNGKVLVHCKAGCSQAAVIDALRGMGLWSNNELPHPSRRAAKQSKPHVFASCDQAIKWIERSIGGTFARHWDYETTNNTLALRVARFQISDGKQFRPLHQTADGWIVGDPLGVLPIYRMLRIRASSGRVFVVEGEKCADAVNGLGLVATTSSHGAGSATKTDWNIVAGREIIIFPDNDPSGIKYATEVAQLVHSLDPPARVKIVELPGLSNGEDIFDFIEQRRAAGLDDAATRAELEQLADDAPYWKPPRSSTAIVTRLSDVKERQVQWLWPGRIPLGKLTMIAGDPGLGKSFLTCDMAARVSRGTSWPDRRGESNTIGSVVIASAEDDVEDTITPRVRAAGGDLSKIVAMQGVEYRDPDSGAKSKRSFTLSDLSALEDAIEQLADCRIVFVDPVSAFIPQRIDSHRNTDIRSLLAPLAELAAQYNVAVVCVSHLNKGAGASALYRVTGSLAFVAAARACWLIARDVNDPTRRLMLPVKMNLARESTGLAYRFLSACGDSEIPTIAWDDDPITVTADEALTGNEQKKSGLALGEAADWLKDRLSGEPVPAKSIKDEALADGFSLRTLDRAKKQLRVIARRQGFGGPWVWRLPETELAYNP